MKWIDSMKGRGSGNWPAGGKGSGRGRGRMAMIRIAINMETGSIQGNHQEPLTIVPRRGLMIGRGPSWRRGRSVHCRCRHLAPNGTLVVPPTAPPTPARSAPPLTATTTRPSPRHHHRPCQGTRQSTRRRREQPLGRTSVPSPRPASSLASASLAIATPLMPSVATGRPPTSALGPHLHRREAQRLGTTAVTTAASGRRPW